MPSSRLLFAFILLIAAPAAAQLDPIPQDRGAVGLGLALRRIGVTPRVLYVTAHPDDEDNGMLVRLSRGLGVRTAILTLTRGDGGQNALGPELFDALAVLRSEELAAVHRYDGAEQYFGLASDFGYSFSVEENLAHWGHEAALEDVVRVMRTFRPDVVITLPLEAPGGGQAHQAAARLALEGFRAAGDPARFPGLGLAPWQARKIYQGGVGGGDAPGRDPSRAVTVRIGVYDPLLGLTWQQLGSVARSMHRSQGSPQLVAPPVEDDASFILLDSVPPAAPREGDVLDGLDLTFGGLLRFAPGHAAEAPPLAASLQALQARTDAARAAFDPNAPEKTLPSLQGVLAGARALADRVRAGDLDPAAREALLDRLRDEERDVERALALAHGLDVAAEADDDVVVPGQSFAVTTRVANLGAVAVPLDEVVLQAAEGWPVRALEGTLRSLGPGESAVFRHEVAVPAGARPSQPHWRRVPGGRRFEHTDPRLAGQPWAPPEVTALVRYRSGGASAGVSEPVHRRYESPAGGEKQKVVAVGSEFSVRLQPEITVVPAVVREWRPREFRVAVKNQRRGPAAGKVRLDARPGIVVEPREAAITFREEGEEVAVRFSMTRPPAAESSVRAIFVDESGREFADFDQVVAYPHVHERRLVRPAASRVAIVDLAVPAGVAVGYVDGTGDEVDAAIRQLGVPLTELSADDLAFGDLSRFSTIVTGIRAYEARPELRSYHHRLMAYVAAGGNLVVQYNRLDFNRAQAVRPGPGRRQPDSPYAPYPAAVTSSRVTDENAPPRILVPDSPLLTTPNRIGDADWRGWVQERGLNFLEARDPRYADVIAFTDPFPLNPGEKKGALVDAPVGRGRWTYVGLGLFRELPAGVPGAWRLLANIVGRPRGK